MLDARLPDAWRTAIAPMNENGHWTQLDHDIELEYRENCVFPPENEIFTALDKVTPEAVRVVILGQDPYHGEGEAHGLAFSVKGTTPIPPSLRNIFKELHNDLHLQAPLNGDLTPWAEQGVLLLNTTLTVRKDCAGSHAHFAWSEFTDHIIRYLAQHEPPKIFVLWGAHARRKKALIEEAKGTFPHLILEANHPSPLSASRGFFGSAPFSKINAQLVAWGRQPIDWQLPTQASLF